MVGPAHPAVCIAIITRERPEGLRRLLEGIASQDYAGPVRVVVVDNDASESARDACGTRWSFGAVDYRVEPRPGIPFARNTAVAALRDEAVLVSIDDDEVPCRGWLRHLVNTQRHYDADAVAGPVVPRFATPPPEWAVRGGFFDRPRLLTGTPLTVVFTGNLLLTRAVVDALSPLFDERLALTGGSDAHLAKRMELAGFSMVWCDEAVCEETVPASRVTPEWVVRRGYRVGTTRAYIEHNLGSRRDRAAVVLRGAANVVRGSAGLPLYALRGRPGLIAGLRRFAIGAGLLAGSLGATYEEYTRIHEV